MNTEEVLRERYGHAGKSFVRMLVADIKQLVVLLTDVKKES